ncbi:hypothetical protein AB0D67_32490 [Streptosporangium sp. NPDC048047]|uniref:hypothetical protein n=1 Tax=Streptosporangium sp. NPDC048047 TaxID=3155748 RepID=UPI003448647B
MREAIGTEPTREQTAVRLLFILDRLGDACDESGPVAAVRVVRAQRKLQKLDFLMRNPDYLADEIITAVEQERLPREQLLAAREVLEQREPELHTYRMLRGQHGAYEPLHNALSVLRYLGLIKVERAGTTSDSYVRRRDYYLLEPGQLRAQQLRSHVPALAWYDEQALYVGLVAQGLIGAELKASQYQHEEYAATPSGRVIAGITERVRPRLAAALEREGLR